LPATNRNRQSYPGKDGGELEEPELSAMCWEKDNEQKDIREGQRAKEGTTLYVWKEWFQTTRWRMDGVSMMK
jgi:hypothetical protein